MFKRVAVGALASCFLFSVAAREVGVAAFNLAWAGTQADFDKHIAVCTAETVKWCDTRAKMTKDAEQPTPEEQARAKSCQTAFAAAAGGPDQALQVAPCNAYKLTAKKWATGPATMYQEKLEGLKGTINTLVSEQKVGVIAFQEVKSAEAIREILGAHASSFETCAAPHNAFQTVGFAWKKSLGQGKCTPRPALSIKEDLSESSSIRKLRPGAELALTIGGQQITFLNVHLKSGCANLHDDPTFKGNLLTSRDTACSVLNRQIEPLESWIEDVAKRSPFFVVLGDFNRKLDEEAREAVAPNKVRTDGSLPNRTNTTDADGSVKSKYLWQEISDGSPALVQVPLGTSATGCKGFTGLDHILLSGDLNARQKVKVTSFKLPVQTKPKQVIGTSDHCPRVTKVAF